MGRVGTWKRNDKKLHDHHDRSQQPVEAEPSPYASGWKRRLSKESVGLYGPKRKLGGLRTDFSSFEGS
jgi:hypothetical protein